MLKISLIGLGVVVVLLVAAVFIVPALIPMETYKSELTARVKAATGRDLTIGAILASPSSPLLESRSVRSPLAMRKARPRHKWSASPA
jgi:uncharacterized protein involved in outer membrane biogenesis